MAAIPGVQRAAFGRTEFHKYISEEGVRDEFGPGFVAHQIPHYNGAKQEEIGGPPWRTRIGLVFSGLTWRDQVSEILGPMLAKPRDVLTHPVWGRIQMVLKAPLTASLDPVRKGSRYDVQLLFEQDNLTADLAITKGPAALSQDVKDHATTADAAAVEWRDLIYARNTRGPQALLIRQKAATAVESVTTFTSAATAYADAALGQFNTQAWDPTLDNRLKALPALSADATAKIRAVAPRSVYAPDIVVEMEQAAKAAVDMDRAILAHLPPPIEWPIREKISLFALVGLIYSRRGLSERLDLMDYIQRINRLGRADVLAPGSFLRVPAP